MRAEIIFTGTELLLGEILNTHSQYLGRKLSALGIEVVRHTVIGDDYELLLDLLGRAVKRSDLIITTGGLGPTTDDLTKEAVARALNLTMEQHQPTLGRIKEYFRQRGKEMPESMLKQTLFPSEALVLPNSAGTAPGAIIRKDDRVIALLPGPPNELKAVYRECLEPFLREMGVRGMVIRSNLLKITGLSESQVQEMIKDFAGRDNPGIAYLAMPGEVHVRVTGKAPSPEEAKRITDELTRKIKGRLGDYIFSTNGDSLEETVGELLTESGYTLATAESCTGGLLSAALTGVPGSSAYFAGGVVAYDNGVKVKTLGVSMDILEHHGAVSRETAEAMARGVRRLLGTKLGLGVTGIAGPGGGTPEKPVGLVYIALDSPDGVLCQEFHFPGGRFGVRRSAVNAGLNMIRRFLLDIVGRQ